MHIYIYKHAHLCTLAYIHPPTQTHAELTSIYDPSNQIYQQHIPVNQKTKLLLMNFTDFYANIYEISRFEDLNTSEKNVNAIEIFRRNVQGFTNIAK